MRDRTRRFVVTVTIAVGTVGVTAWMLWDFLVAMWNKNQSAIILLFAAPFSAAAPLSEALARWVTHGSWEAASHGDGKALAPGQPTFLKTHWAGTIVGTSILATIFGLANTEPWILLFLFLAVSQGWFAGLYWCGLVSKESRRVSESFAMTAVVSWVAWLVASFRLMINHEPVTWLVAAVGSLGWVGLPWSYVYWQRRPGG